MKTANETILHIDLAKLEQNFNYFKSILNPETQIIAVVKAFAYGHGDIKISKKLEKLGIYALWVSDFEEGVALRLAGIKSKIIVANPGIKSYNEIIKHKLDVVIYTQKLLDLYCSKNDNVNIHIKFNTGMNRYGFDANEVSSITNKINNNSHLKLLSVCSHLAASSNKEKKEFTLSQIKLFKEIIFDFKTKSKQEFYTHILNSNGVLNFNEHQMEMVRIGIGLYGSNEDENLNQISSLKSVITQIRKVRKGDFIGYDNTFKAERDMKIAIVPVGYADGLNRQFSNAVGSVFIKKAECKIIGKISMDSFAIDISNISTKLGDEVEILGENLHVTTIAKKINTIPYEIYSTLNRRLKRFYSDS